MAYQDFQATRVVDLSRTADQAHGPAHKLALSKLGTRQSREWVGRVLDLLDQAVRQLPPGEQAAHGTVLEATALLREQIDQQAAQRPDGNGGLLAWQARKVLAYIDSHITRRVLVADLCALIDRSDEGSYLIERDTVEHGPS